MHCSKRWYLSRSFCWWDLDFSNEPKFVVESDLRNEKLSPFSEGEDEVLCNKSQEDDEEEVEYDSPITTVPPYYIPLHMHNFEESKFEDSEYDHSLDNEEVQNPVGTLFEGMRIITKKEVQHALQ